MPFRSLIFSLIFALLLIAPSACSIKKVTFKPIGPGGAGGEVGAAGAGGNGGGPGGTAGKAGAGGAAGAAGAAGVTGAGGVAGAAGAAGAGGAAGSAGTGGAAGAHDAGVDHPATGGSPLDGGRRDAVAEAGTDGPPACPYSLVPVMTGPMTPSGLVLESGSIDSTTYDGWQAFDASSTTMWISAIGESPAVIGYVWDYLAPQTVVSYAITYANGSILTRAPSAWTLEALSGDQWITIDERGDETGWAGFERRVYNVALPGSYPQYRLNITDDNDPTPGIVVISIGKLELIGCPTPPPPT